jgi:hypothetical protein
LRPGGDAAAPLTRQWLVDFSDDDDFGHFGGELSDFSSSMRASIGGIFDTGVLKEAHHLLG